MLEMDRVSMYLNTEFTNTSWQDLTEHLQVRWPPVKQLLGKMLGKMWPADSLLPVRTVLGKHQPDTSIYTLTTVRRSTISETSGMAVRKPSSKSVSINLLVDKAAFKTQTDVVVKETCCATPSLQYSEAECGSLGSWLQKKECSSDHDSLVSFSHVKDASAINIHTFSNFHGCNSSGQAGTLFANDELVPTGLHQNSENDIVAGLQAFRNSADQKCPLYLVFSSTRRHIRQNDASLQSLGPVGLLTNLLCPLSPYLKKPPTPDQDHPPAIAVPAGFLRTYMSTKLGPLTSFLQSKTYPGIRGLASVPGLFGQETGELTLSASSDEHSESFDPPSLSRPGCNVQNMQDIHAAPPSETIDSASTTTTEEYQSLCGSSSSPSSHVGAKCRGGPNTGDASCYQGSSGGQHGTDQHSRHKRKRGQQKCDRDHGKGKIDGSDDDDDDYSPDSGNTRSAGSKSRQPRGLACPYNKFDPRKFRDQGNGTSKYQSCTREFVNTADVTQHLKRVHDYDESICVRCLTKYTTEELIDHLRKDQLCDLKPWSVIEEEKLLIRGCDRWSRLKKLGKKSPRQSYEKRWYQMFTAIFPDAPRPPSAYHDGITHTEGTDGSVTPPMQSMRDNLDEFVQNGHHMGAWSSFSNMLGAPGSLVDSPSLVAQSYQASMGQPSLSDNHTSLGGFQQSYSVDPSRTMSQSFPSRQPATPTNYNFPVQASSFAASFPGGFGQYSNGQRLQPFQQQQLHRQQTRIRCPQQQQQPPPQSSHTLVSGPQLAPVGLPGFRQYPTGRGTRYVTDFNVPNHSAQHPNDLEDIFDTNPQQYSGFNNMFYQDQDTDDVN